MKNEVVVIDQREVLGKEFRIYGTVDNPMFLAKDVANWIEHSNARMMLNNVDDDEKVVNNVYTLGGVQETWFLTEDGLYEVLMQSRKPIAKEFKKQVKTILKEIRRHGMYATDELLDNPDLLIKVATQLKEEREKRKQLETENMVKDQIIGELKPKADYTDKILQSKDLLTITQIAKDYGMTSCKMNHLLHSLGIQFKQNGQWILYSKYHNKGYTRSVTVPYTNKAGDECSNMHTKWTQKGRLFIYNKLKENGILPLMERE